MVQPDLENHFTCTTHKKSYPAISTGLPTLSAAKKTILVTGRARGIGLAIATSFAAAKAAIAILVARCRDAMVGAKQGLEKAYPATNFHIYTTDIADAPAVKTLFVTICAEVADPDIIVLNAAQSSPPGATLANPAELRCADFEVNVLGNIRLIVEYFCPGRLTKPKIMLNESIAGTQ